VEERAYNGEVTTDGARLRGEWVGGTEDLAAGLDDLTALPDHGADGAAAHVYPAVSVTALQTPNAMLLTYR
jgi:hypothetical protein